MPVQGGANSGFGYGSLTQAEVAWRGREQRRVRRGTQRHLVAGFAHQPDRVDSGDHGQVLTPGRECAKPRIMAVIREQRRGFGTPVLL